MLISYYGGSTIVISLDWKIVGGIHLPTFDTSHADVRKLKSLLWSHFCSWWRNKCFKIAVHLTFYDRWNRLYSSLVVLTLSSWTDSDTEVYLLPCERPTLWWLSLNSCQNQVSLFSGVPTAHVFSHLVFRRHLSKFVGEERFQLFHSILSLFLNSACHLTANWVLEDCVPAPLPSSDSCVIQTCIINVETKQTNTTTTN